VLEFPGGFAGHDVSVRADGADLDGAGDAPGMRWGCAGDALGNEIRTADRTDSAFGGECTRSGDIASKLACGVLAPASLGLGPWLLLPLEAMLVLDLGLRNE
jgi:hypothetical protein